MRRELRRKKISTSGYAKIQILLSISGLPVDDGVSLAPAAVAVTGGRCSGWDHLRVFFSTRSRDSSSSPSLQRGVSFFARLILLRSKQRLLARYDLRFFMAGRLGRSRLSASFRASLQKLAFLDCFRVFGRFFISAICDSTSRIIWVASSDAGVCPRPFLGGFPRRYGLRCLLC